MRIEKLRTPALLLDLGVVKENTRLLGEITEGSSLELYPHYKSHKCTELARLQLELGAKGITCAKLSEAKDLVNHGIRNVVIANQIVQPEKLQELAVLAKNADVTVCVDSEENVKDLRLACAAAGSRVKVLVEFEVGMQRCGVESFQDVLRLAMKINEQPCLSFEGIQAYAGHLAHETDAERRKSEMLLIEARVAELKKYLECQGIPVRQICGGSTGTAADKPKDTVYTQLQAGSYLFMDESYRRLGLSFAQSLYVVTTVISVKEDRFVVDCGTKSLSMDQVPPRFLGFEDCRVSFSEEHSTVFANTEGMRLGDSILCVPGHCCTTVNNFRWLYVMENNQIKEKWAVESSSKAQ